MSFLTDGQVENILKWWSGESFLQVQLVTSVGAVLHPAACVTGLGEDTVCRKFTAVGA